MSEFQPYPKTGEEAEPPRRPLMERLKSFGIHVLAASERPRMTLDEYYDATPDWMIPNDIASHPVPTLPNTFEELEAGVKATNNPNCEIQNRVDKFVGLIRGGYNRDGIVRLLPYRLKRDGGLALFFVLPQEDTNF